jgi:hypothetical protein
VIALGVTVVFSMMVVTLIESARSNSRSSTMSVGRMSAYNLAEAGINNAMSVLRVPTNNALDDYVFCGVSVTVPTVAAGTYPCKHTDTYSAGTVTWYGTLYLNAVAHTAYWDLFSTGHVRNPYGGAKFSSPSGSRRKRISKWSGSMPTSAAMSGTSATRLTVNSAIDSLPSRSMITQLRSAWGGAERLSGPC